jgi:hypothetical protein
MTHVTSPRDKPVNRPAYSTTIKFDKESWIRAANIWHIFNQYVVHYNAFHPEFVCVQLDCSCSVSKRTIFRNIYAELAFADVAVFVDTVNKCIEKENPLKCMLRRV